MKRNDFKLLVENWRQNLVLENEEDYNVADAMTDDHFPEGYEDLRPEMNVEHQYNVADAMTDDHFPEGYEDLRPEGDFSHITSDVRETMSGLSFLQQKAILDKLLSELQ